MLNTYITYHLFWACGRIKWHISSQRFITTVHRHIIHIYLIGKGKVTQTIIMIIENKTIIIQSTTSKKTKAISNNTFEVAKKYMARWTLFLLDFLWRYQSNMLDMLVKPIVCPSKRNIRPQFFSLHQNQKTASDHTANTKCDFIHPKIFCTSLSYVFWKYM